MRNVITLQSVRRHARVECEVRATVSCGGRALEGLCKNLSLGGMWLDVPGLPEGSAVEVTLWLGSPEAVLVRGEIRRTSGEGLGIQFQRLAPAELVRLHRFVAEGLGMLEAA
jgi:hypothetical protein